MNQKNKNWHRLLVIPMLTLLLAANALAAPKNNPTVTSKSAQGWCVEDICLGQPESVLKPFASTGLPPIAGASCTDGTHRYVISRTDGVLEVTADGAGKIVELARGYSDQITLSQFNKMAAESARKLAAKTVFREQQDTFTVLKLKNDALQSHAELRFSPNNPVALTVKLAQNSSTSACLAKAAVIK